MFGCRGATVGGGRPLVAELNRSEPRIGLSARHFRRERR